MRRGFTLQIVAGMVLGIVVGAVANQALADAAAAKAVAGYLSIVTDIFLRLIKMIIAPLVLSTLVTGIVHVGDSSSLGRLGVFTIGWFICASIVSLCLGLLLVNALEPGVGLGLPLPETGAEVAIKGTALTLKEFITHLVPRSFFEAMANTEILQIVVFSVFTGVALSAMGEAAKPIVDILDRVVAMTLLIVGYVMRFAPFAVFAAIAATVTIQGLGILVTYLKFVGGFYLALAILWAFLVAAGFVMLGPSVINLTRLIREPLLLSFSTASSEAAYPKTLEGLEKYGVPPRIASFVLPLGYSFNLDGSMMYCTFATVFIAQAYGIELSLAQEITMLLILMVTSKGMAGVPRASLVVIAATLAQFGIPEAGLLLILAVDQFLDMGRSATNVVGNAIATAVVHKWNAR
ncbi:MAG: dicarboxylate/amino acid:cation symporter [Alphaproteobacteria bacterium]|nr:dicarboxylate/amino acid:cation symporter [Alphaproteobacteria bacterium]